MENQETVIPKPEVLKDSPIPPGTHLGELKLEKFYYDNKIVRDFGIASVTWGIISLLVGVFIASQLYWPGLNVSPILTFGRLRALHTNGAIFAFVGNMM